jgi:adenylylsulfate kinase-like enzyme
MVEAGLVVIAAFISPRPDQRIYARTLFKEGQFLEVFVDAPIEVCISRDAKGLYKKAELTKISNLTAIHQLYERPINPDLRIETGRPSQLESLEIL